MYKAIHCGEVIATGKTRKKAEDNALKAHWYAGYKYHVKISTPSGEESKFFYGDETPSQFGPLNVVREKKQEHEKIINRIKGLGLPVGNHTPKIN